MNLTIIKHAILSAKPDSLATLALAVIYEQLVVVPLQRAWKRKDHKALRKKYICSGCKKPISYDKDKHKCVRCRYIEYFILSESRLLDGLFG
jgi:hypothetical protein